MNGGITKKRKQILWTRCFSRLPKQNTSKSRNKALRWRETDWLSLHLHGKHIGNSFNSFKAQQRADLASIVSNIRSSPAVAFDQKKPTIRPFRDSIFVKLRLSDAVNDTSSSGTKMSLGSPAEKAHQVGQDLKGEIEWAFLADAPKKISEKYDRHIQLVRSERVALNPFTPLQDFIPRRFLPTRTRRKTKSVAWT